MKRTSGLAALALAAALTLAACSSGGSESDPAEPTSDGELATFTEEPAGDIDRVVWNLPYGEPATLDWIHSYSYSENTVEANLCESLHRLTPDYKIEPGLATSTEHPNPTTYVYKIRQGVTFWNGSPMTVDDVVYSLRRHLDPNVGSFWADYYANVKSVESTGVDEVTVTLTEPDAYFDRWMATPAGAVGEAAFIQSAGAGYGTPDGGISCTGPFKLGAWEKGSSITLERNDDYWDTSHQARAETFQFEFLVDEGAATSALVSGQIDGTYDAPLAGLASLASAPGKLWLGETQLSVALLPTERKSPLQDLKIRQALALAIDYDGIVKQIYKDTATPLRAYAGPGTWGYAEDQFADAYDQLPPAETDLEAARQLVIDAGSPQEEILIASVSDIPLYAQLASIVQDAGKKIGLNVQLKTFPTSTYTTFFFDRDARNQTAAIFTTNYTDLPDPLPLYVGFDPASFYNFTGYDNPEVSAALGEARHTEDEDERAGLVIEIQEQVTADKAVLPIVQPANRLFMGDRITGAPASFVYLYYPWAADVGAKG